jgi:hypothetical protein
MFITAFIKVRQLPLICTRCIRSKTSHPISLRPILILSYHLRLCLPRDLFPSGSRTKNLYAFLISPICVLPGPPIPSSTNNFSFNSSNYSDTGDPEYSSDDEAMPLASELQSSCSGLRLEEETLVSFIPTWFMAVHDFQATNGRLNSIQLHCTWHVSRGTRYFKAAGTSTCGQAHVMRTWLVKSCT